MAHWHIKLLSTAPCILYMHCAEYQRQHGQLRFFCSCVVLVRGTPTGRQGRRSNPLLSRSMDRVVVSTGCLVCRTRHDRDLESNMNASICVKTRNRDLESGWWTH